MKRHSIVLVLLAVAFLIVSVVQMGRSVSTDVWQKPGEPVPENLTNPNVGTKLATQVPQSTQYRVECGDALGILFTPVAGTPVWQYGGGAQPSVGPCMKAAFYRFLLIGVFLILAIAVLVGMWIQRLRSTRLRQEQPDSQS
jgi:hypothetical protein